MNAPLSAVLSDLRARLQALYGARLDRLVLYGSRARGDADAESDIDVLVVLADEQVIRENEEAANAIVCELSLKYDNVVSCVYTTPEKLDRSGMPFYRNVRREGVPV